MIDFFEAFLVRKNVNHKHLFTISIDISYEYE